MKTAIYNVYPAETTDYAPIAQKAIVTNPDVVILGTTSQDDSVALTKAFIFRGPGWRNDLVFQQYRLSL